MSAVDVAAPPPVPAAAGSLDRWSRWSDRLNPILVREVQQAMRGRAFVLSVLVALVISIIIAVDAVGDYDAAPNRAGRGVFQAGLATLAPLLLFVVPMQAFQSMRLELRSGIVEQLLLSELRPWRILAGKLQAAMVQFVLFLAVLSPLLATSYLLRGVDLPTIGIALLFAFVLCAVATMFAVSSAAQARLPSLQGLANLGTAFGLGLSAFGAVTLCLSGGFTMLVAELLRSGELTAILSGFVLCAVAAIVLMALAAQSSLLHAFENKSTGFRVMLFVVPVVAFGWLLAFAPPTARAETFAVLCFLALLFGIVFGVFMVTEQRDLSPRVRAHVPRSGLLATLGAPFLPGRDRGLLCFAIYLLLLGAAAALWWPPSRGGLFDMSTGLWRVGTMTAGYACFYLWLGHLLRGRLPTTVQGNQLARFLLPLTLLAFVLVPILIDVFVRGSSGNWHPGHLLNPFWTIAEFDRRDGGMPIQLFCNAVIVGFLMLSLPIALRGVREVGQAAARRRELPPPPPPAADQPQS